MATILVVCTGNICRSPTTASFLRRELGARLGPLAPEVRSAGTLGWDGNLPPPEAVAAGAELGIDLSSHRAAGLTERMVEEADLVLAMASEHRDAIVEVVPDARARTFTLKELIPLLEGLPPDGDRALAPRVAAADALRASRPGQPEDLDVADPLGGSLDDYRRAAREIQDLVDRFVRAMWGTGAVERTPGVGAGRG